MLDITAVENLLNEFRLWHELDQQAKQKYQAQIAPEFRLMAFLRNDENALSSYLGLLLDPNGAHGQSALYLNKFLDFFQDQRFIPKASEYSSSHTEFRLPSGRRLDLYLRFSSGAIAIENKPWATDQDDQLHDYARYLDKQHADWLLIYLSNADYSERSLPANAPLSLRERIVTFDFFRLKDWLEDCARHTKAGAVRLFVEALAQFVEHNINGELHVDNPQELTRLMLRNEENLKAAFVISQHLREAKREMWRNFLSYLEGELSKVGVELFSDQALLDGSPQGHFGIRFDPSHLFGMGWAFDRGNHGKLYFGICRWDEGENADLDIQPLGEYMNVLCGVTGSATKWWPWWTYDARAYTSISVPSNWDTDPNAWLMLNDRGSTGFAYQVIDMVKRMQREFNMKLLVPRRA
ncbi:PD-(D/E)XK nuclease family protein [Pseudomonas sp. NPDC090755]|uniref:PDDEXK-like family protein n=1 Tax=Pseudomonas sp. NPDC090755 TaxID=3364481 RepID=UPI00383A4FA4